MASVKRSRGASNLADDGLFPIVKSTDKGPVIEIFKTSKHFWRARCRVELVFMYHPSLDCIEIIGYEHNKELETTKLYVTASMVIRKCQESDAYKNSANERNKERDSRKKTKFDDGGNIMVDLDREFLCNFLMSRIELITETVPKSTLPLISPSNSGDEGENSCERSFTSPAMFSIDSNSTKSTDGTDGNTELNLILIFQPKVFDNTIQLPNSDKPRIDFEISCPEGINMVKIDRPRRHTSMEMFEIGLKSFKADQKQLQMANKRAQRLANITKMGTQSFMNGYKNRKLREKTYSQSKIRWHWAYRCVLIKIYILKLTMRLNKIYNNCYPVQGLFGEPLPQISPDSNKKNNLSSKNDNTFNDNMKNTIKDTSSLHISNEDSQKILTSSSLPLLNNSAKKKNEKKSSLFSGNAAKLDNI